MADINTDDIQTPKPKGLGWGLATGALGGLAVAAFIASGAWAIIGVGLLAGAAYTAYKTVTPNKAPDSVDAVDKLDTGLSDHNSPPHKVLEKSTEQRVQEDKDLHKKALHPLKPKEHSEAGEGPAKPSTDWVDSIRRDNPPSAGIG